MRIQSFILLFGMIVPLKAQDGDRFPPKLPNGQTAITLSEPAFLKAPVDLPKEVGIAKTVPTVDFQFYPGQTYAGKPWSNWGDGLAVDGKYYSAIGDHLAPHGNAYVYEYDDATKTLKQLVDVRKLLKLPEGHYTPGKIHSRIDLGSDGWLYFATHRGSTRITTAQYHYQGDWIIRHHPQKGLTEIVKHAPLPFQCMPTSVLDPKRLIFYAGTQDGANVKKPQFLAYDVKDNKLVFSHEVGPARYMIFAPSTGRVYFHQRPEGKDKADAVEALYRFDPAKPDQLTPIDAKIVLRAATEESKSGKVYTIDRNQLWVFDTKTEKAELIGDPTFGGPDYVTSIDLDPKTERYLYYIPGAHGGAERIGTPLVQFDLKTKTKKVIAFLYAPIHAKAGFVPIGTFSTAVSPDGARVYVTWNGATQIPSPLPKKVPFEVCAFSVVHIPASERLP